MLKIDYVEIAAIRDQTREPMPSAKEIALLAESVLACDGLIQPVIVQEISIDEYVLLAGKAHFLAVQYAAEKNPEIVHIHAIVAENKKEAEALLTQYQKLLQLTPGKASSIPPLPSSPVKEPNQALSEKIEIMASEQKERFKQLEERIKTLEIQLGKQMQLLETIAGQLAKLNEKPPAKTPSRAKSKEDPDVLLKEKNYEALTVPVLKEELKRRSISFTKDDKKNDLVAKLKADDAKRGH